MQAVILAAGVGKRLAAVAGDQPKCLLELGGRSLLSRHLDTLTSLGVTRVVVVVGYQEQKIRDAVQRDPHGSCVEFVVNANFTRGSITSLWEARDAIMDDVVIMDADVLYDHHILRRLVDSAHVNAVLLDETVTQTTEECMVAVRDERVVCVSKTLPSNYDTAGEGVGFLKLRCEDVPQLITSVEEHITAGRLDMEYEDALAGLFRTVVVGYERIGGMPWIEIDFPEDVRRAERDILPRLTPLPAVSAHIATG